MPLLGLSRILREDPSCAENTFLEKNKGERKGGLALHLVGFLVDTTGELQQMRRYSNKGHDPADDRTSNVSLETKRIIRPSTKVFSRRAEGSPS
jgi:hypothetical protein